MIRALAFAAVLVCASPATAQQVGASGNWPTIVSAETATPDDILQMAADFPNSALMQLRVAQASIAIDDRAGARAALWRYLRMGGVLSERAVGFVRGSFDDPEWNLFTARMAYNQSAITGSEEVASAPAELGLVEGITVSPHSGDPIVSSVTERAVFSLGAGGWERLTQAGELVAGNRPDAGSVMGLAFDGRRDWLWAASSVVQQTPQPQSAFSGLIGIGPGNDQVLWLPVDEAARPGDVAIGPNGDVYLSGSGDGSIHVRRLGGVTLEQLVPAGRIRSAQGMAVTPDGSALIIADYSYGLARLDLASGTLDQLTHDGAEMLDGIDGLSLHGSSLIAIRNGVQPHALLAIDINSDGSRIEQVRTLERANPAWGEPTLGAVHDGFFYYVADARWGEFGEGGALADGALPRPTTVRRIQLQ